MASGGTGTGGSFVPLQGRLVDTRNGTGGYSTPQPSSGWRSYPVAGVAGIPATGVASVAVTVTAVAGSALGHLGLASNTALPPSGTPATFLIWNAGDTVSNTGIVDVGTDGKIAVQSTLSVNILIDVQGWFTIGDGSPASGGYVSASNSRIVDTRSNFGATGPLTTGSTTTVQATGAGGIIPATATAIYANVTVLTTSTTGGFVTPYSTGTSRPATSLNYTGSSTSGVTSATALGATIDVNSSGQFNLYVGTSGGSIQVLVDIEGYFDGEPSTSGFYPLANRVLDTRVSPAVPLPANSVTTLQLGGAHGIPVASASLAGVALNLQTITGTGGGGYLKMWPSDASEPGGSVINYDPSSDQSNLTMIRPGLTDGKINIRNSGPSINLVIDTEGYFTNPSVLPQAIGPNDGGSGNRTAQALISRALTDRISAKVNPTNGNLLITQALLSLTGIGQSASVALRYNAKNDARPTLNVGLFEAQLYRNGSTGTVTYTSPDGAAYIFYPTGASYTGSNAAGTSATVYSYNAGPSGDNSPAGINANLVRVGATYGPGTEYDLTFHPSQAMNVYSDDGSNITLNSSQDVTGHNHLTYTYARGALTTITDTQGRTISFAYADPNNVTQPSTITDNSLGRTIALTYGGPQGALSKVVDATGSQTLFAYNAAGKLSSLTDGRGTVTAFTYDSGYQLLTMTAAFAVVSPTPVTTAAVSSWVYGTGSPTRTTTFTDPNNHTQVYTVGSVSSQVISVTDGLNHPHASAYNGHNDTTQQTSALGDATNYAVATSTYNLMSITAPTGDDGVAGRNVNYQYNSAPSGPGSSYATSDYRPNSSTDAQGNQTASAYNTWGEAITITTPLSDDGVTREGGVLHRTYQGDSELPVPSCGGKPGQLCTSTDGNGNITSYNYDTAGNVATVSSPSPLGVQTFTYDPAGRKITEVDGNGHTAYTCYDNNDRITQVSYTSASCTTASGVAYTYDSVGNMTNRTGGTAATSVVYDGMNRPLSKTVGSVVTSETYDRADNVLTFSDNAGTTTYRYDAANKVIALAEPGGSCPAAPAVVVTPNLTKCTAFAYNSNDLRTTTSFPNGVINTVAYDHSSREQSISATTTTPSATLAARVYTYTRTSGASTVDSSQIWTTSDPVANTESGYLYDHLNRLKQTATGPIPAAGTPVVPTSTTSWIYDADGNRTQQSGTGGTTNYGYNAADQLCWTAGITGTGCTTPTGGTGYTYDGNGNQTSAGNTYNNYDQLVDAAAVGTQAYAGTTNSERTTAGSITFSNSIMGSVNSSSTSLGGPQEYVRDPTGSIIALQSGGSSYYYTTDTIGSTILLTDGAGVSAASYTYGSYGDTVTATGTMALINPWRYTSGWTDTNGLIKDGARYYNPTLGRFTQTDPSGQEDNGYAYVGDNPINESDPKGLCGEWYAVVPCPAPYVPAPTDGGPLIDVIVGSAFGYVIGETCELLDLSACGFVAAAVGGASSYGLDQYGKAYGYDCYYEGQQDC